MQPRILRLLIFTIIALILFGIRSLYETDNEIEFNYDSVDTLDKNVVFAMIGRNVDRELPHVMKNIHALSKAFGTAKMASSRVIFVENDSIDKSVDTFIGLARLYNLSFHVLSLQTNWPIKTGAALALARQLALDTVINGYTADWLIIVDSDMCFPWSIPRITKILSNLVPFEQNVGVKHEFEWTALFANGACGWYTSTSVVKPYTQNGLPFYCDRLAFRDSNITDEMNGQYRSPPLFWNSPVLVPYRTCSVRKGTWNGWECRLMRASTGQFVHEDEEYWNGREVDGVEPVVRVDSAFGGFGVYSLVNLRRLISSAVNSTVVGGDAVVERLTREQVNDRLLRESLPSPRQSQRCFYDHNDASKFDGCEHVSFHACLRERLQGSLWILPRLTVEWEGCT
jgi:hypothetical protein